MHTKLWALAALSLAAAILTGVAAANPAAVKQRIAIQQAPGGFVLKPMTAGALVRDAGAVGFCCWGSRVVVRDGLKVEINDPLMTLAGKQGTLEARNEVEWVDVAKGYAVGILKWKVVRGTGAYARLSGGGRGVIIVLPNGDSKWLREGFVGAR